MRTVAFDTETWLIAPGRLAPRLVCLSWSDGDTTTLLDRDEAVAWFRAQLDTGTRLVGHHVAFDVGVMVQADPTLMPLAWAHYDNGLFYDTAVADRLHHIACGWYKVDQSGKKPKFSLSALSARYLGSGLEGKTDRDAWRYRYRELDGIPIANWPDAAVDYAKEDARVTYRVWESLKKQGVSPDFRAQCRSAWSLHLISAWGLRTDETRVASLKSTLQETVDAATQQLKEEAIYRENGTKDVKEIRRRVSAAMGKDAPKTAKGSISTSKDVLMMTGDPCLELLASISNDSKLLSTYIPVLERGTTRPICPQYWLVESGRTSARGPNIQNQPRMGGIRECWIPRDGYVYVACDYHIAELCGLAQVCLDWFGKSKMAEAINAGRDLHLVTGSEILGISYEKIEEMYRAGKPKAKEARQLAKACNFGYPGGLGVGSFCDFAKTSYGMELTEKKAKELKQKWLSSYPEMGDYFNKIGEFCGVKGEYDAVQARSNRVRGAVGFCDGANTYFQGIVADGARLATYRAVRETYTRGSAMEGSRAVAFVHDELILESPEERAADAAARLSEIMVAGMKEFLPDIVVRATPHLMRRWYKNAGPVFLNGVLVPWGSGSTPDVR